MGVVHDVVSSKMLPVHTSTHTTTPQQAQRETIAEQLQKSAAFVAAVQAQDVARAAKHAAEILHKQQVLILVDNMMYSVFT